ncbi:MAG TPA: TIGR01777 family oxidoreductase [Candidatus Baltobacteraceae bacterium]|nr:TIGR01777 family oxidoreductase [Candidatus Baltobacteraceae bacterium]
MRVGLIGGTGFIGRHLQAALRARGDDVVLASLREPDTSAVAVRSCDALVNLAGEPIAQRWTAAAKERMRASRVDAPRALLDALARDAHHPPAYISASAIGYYPPSESATYTEASNHGNDFLGELCAAWEREAHRAAELGMRVAIVRTGVVLGVDGGALGMMLPAFRFGFGGVIGDGRQWVSWVHVDDVVGIYLHALDGAEGTFNATAPQPVTNAQLTHALGRALHRPTVLPTPTFALRAILGEGADILLSGARVLPEHTIASGYRFAFTGLDSALRDLLH